MDIISFNEAATANGRIEKFIKDPDSNSGIVTVPKVIGAGENVTVPAGRVAVLPNIQVDGEITVEAGAEIFVPSGSSLDFSTGIKVNGEKLTMSIPTAYHIYNGSVEATNTILTNGFSTTLHTGNGTTQDIVTGVDMATQWGDDTSEMFGGLVWTKGRNNTVGREHNLQDSIRGTSVRISSSTTNGNDTLTNGITSFNNNGVTVGANASVNENTFNYVSWNFQTTHRRTGVTNHGKAYTEHYNPFTGFTIIKYTGSGTAGHEIPHSLNRKLGFVTFKKLSAVENWIVQYESNSYLYLNLTNASATSNVLAIFNENHMSVQNNSGYNTLNNEYIMYGWANSYYDKNNTLIGNYEIGVYQGTGAAGNKVKTRGKPAWVMIKRLDSTGNWVMQDNLRGISYELYANLSNAQTAGANIVLNLDGFTNGSILADTNASGGQYLYMVVYDNDSGSGKSKYPKATDTTNLSINALVPYANGIDVNGSKVSIEYKNETITGLTLTQGKNYVYSKNDGTYGVNKYEPLYGSLRNRSVAGENPDYFDLKTMKWYGTTGGNELVTNGTFDVDTSGWTSTGIVWGNGTAKATSAQQYSYQQITGLDANKTYKVSALLSTTGNNYCILDVCTTNNGFADIARLAILGATTSGYYSATFTGHSTVWLELESSTITSGACYWDNISVFEVEPTIGAEITPRTYLDCVVYADHNGQVSYVEELPKTTYFDEVKANEFKGKNACTAWVNFDGTTTPPAIRDSYNVKSVVRTGTGVFDVYFDVPMDKTSYIVNITPYPNRIAGTFSNTNTEQKFTVDTRTQAGILENIVTNNIYVTGGKN